LFTKNGIQRTLPEIHNYFRGRFHEDASSCSENTEVGELSCWRQKVSKISRKYEGHEEEEEEEGKNSVHKSLHLT
jgi:hypothetical protein